MRVVFPGVGLVGLQLQESLITLATQQGMGVIEYKADRDLNLGQRFDVMLSRDLEKLNDQSKVNYFSMQHTCFHEHVSKYVIEIKYLSNLPFIQVLIDQTVPDTF